MSKSLKIIHVHSSSSLPKYKQIVQSIEVAIAQNRLKRNDKLPSINKIALEYGLSRDTVLLAYDELKKRGVVYARLGKGYYVKSIQTGYRERIFLLFDELNAFKEEIYTAFLKGIGDKTQVEIFFHHFNPEVFRKLIDESNGNYTKYIIMPANLATAASSIKTLPTEDVYILDQTNEALKAYPSVHQHFVKDMYDALVKGSTLLKKYRRLFLIFPGHKEPVGMMEGFLRFCKEHSFEHQVVETATEVSIEKGAVFIIPNDGHLVEIIEQSKQQHLKLGTDFGIISFNDIPLKKVVENGITTISTDFRLMGATLADMVLTGRRVSIENPSELIIRHSL